MTHISWLRNSYLKIGMVFLVFSLIITSPVTANDNLPCNEKWECTAWSVCVNNKQTRECWDANKCSTREHKPLEKLPCRRDKKKGKRVDTAVGTVKLKVVTTTTTTLPVRRAEVGMTGALTGGGVASDSVFIVGILIMLLVISILSHRIVRYPKNFEWPSKQ